MKPYRPPRVRSEPIPFTPCGGIGSPQTPPEREGTDAPAGEHQDLAPLSGGVFIVPGRFWSKVDRTPTCWLWTAAINTTGYGAFGVTRSRARPAHRVAWELERGELPAGVLLVNTCGNKRCVRPEHQQIKRGLDYGFTEASGQLAAELYARHASYLRSYIAKARGLSRAEAEDVVHDAFARAAVSLRELRPGASALSFMGLHVRHAAFTFKLSPDREAAESGVDLDHAIELPADVEPADASLERHQLRLAVRALISRLPPALAHVMREFELNGRPQAEIARELGVTEKWVRNLAYRARVEFRQLASTEQMEAA